MPATVDPSIDFAVVASAPSSCRRRLRSLGFISLHVSPLSVAPRHQATATPSDSSRMPVCHNGHRYVESDSNISNLPFADRGASRISSNLSLEGSFWMRRRRSPNTTKARPQVQRKGLQWKVDWKSGPWAKTRARKDMARRHFGGTSG